jgi:hypothetical protein
MHLVDFKEGTCQKLVRVMILKSEQLDGRDTFVWCDMGSKKYAKKQKRVFIHVEKTKDMAKNATKIILLFEIQPYTRFVDK